MSSLLGGQASPQLGPLTGPDPWGSTLPYRVYHTPKCATYFCMCECATPKVLRASRRSGVLIIPKSAPLLNLEGWLIDATGYAPGLPSPMRPISVLAQNLGGIPSVLIQVLFPYLYVYYREGWPKAMKACKTPVCYVAKTLT